MRVVKVINNNVVSCLDNAGRELVVMGRGLGFHTSPGDNLAEDQVEKVFRLSTQDENIRLRDLVSRLPEELLELCSRIIEYAAQALGRRLNESIYLTLTDHIWFVLSRVKEGMIFQNALLTEVRIFYPSEFAVGKYALDLIQEEQGISLPEDEAASIALHLVNAEYDTQISRTMRITQTLHTLLEQLRSWDGLKLAEGTLLYDELIIHLKFFVMRAFAGDMGPVQDTAFSEVVRVNFPKEYACAKAIAASLRGQCGCGIPPEELACLTIHIHRASV